MMMRAEAPVFKPKVNTAEADKESSTLGEESCSTVAPSPALTGQSPSLSFWGLEESMDSSYSADDVALWQASLYGGYPLPDEFGNYPPDFALPENFFEASSFADFSSRKRGRAHSEPVYAGEEFQLQGAEELQNQLAAFLKGANVTEKKDVDTEVSSPPSGLAPPPGLECPPGFGADEVEAPPGLEGAPRGKARERAHTWTYTKSPLPAGTTTAMLKNIPNKYTQQGLVDRLHEAGFLGELDFIYLPIDFKNKCNVGYAFMNFRTAEACARFAIEFHQCSSRDKLPGYNSKKVCEVSPARHQGCEENIRRLQGSKVMEDLVKTPEWLPKLFDEYGQELEFPVTDTMSREVQQQKYLAQGRMQRRK